MSRLANSVCRWGVSRVPHVRKTDDPIDNPEILPLKANSQPNANFIPLAALVLLAACTANWQPNCTANCDAGVLSIPATGETELTLGRRGVNPAEVFP